MLGTSGINEIYFQHTFLREKKKRDVLSTWEKFKKKHLMITMYSVLWFLSENFSMDSCFEQLLALQLVTQF